MKTKWQGDLHVRPANTVVPAAALRVPPDKRIVADYERLPAAKPNPVVVEHEPSPIRRAVVPHEQVVNLLVARKPKTLRSHELLNLIYEARLSRRFANAPHGFVVQSRIAITYEL